MPKATKADFQPCSITGFRSSRFLRWGRNIKAQWQAPIWTCCQGEKQKEPDHSLQASRGPGLRFCCLKWQWPLLNTVRDYRTPMICVSLRATRGGRQVPLGTEGRTSAAVVLSTHMCIVTTIQVLQGWWKKSHRKPQTRSRGLMQQRLITKPYFVLWTHLQIYKWLKKIASSCDSIYSYWTKSRPQPFVN